MSEMRFKQWKTNWKNMEMTAQSRGWDVMLS
jgi:hypothetical protein